MSAKDYYKILGVDEKAGDGEIKKAYRRLAKECHPDANPGDKQAEERFKEISEAYEVLGDKAKRQKYDQMRKFGFGDRAVRAPEWVPVFTGSIDKGTIVQRTAEGEKRIVRAEVPAMGSSIVSFYERAFEQMGYTFTNEQNGTEANLAAESADGARTITVAVSSRGARSTLVLTHLERLRPAAP